MQVNIPLPSCIRKAHLEELHVAGLALAQAVAALVAAGHADEEEADADVLQLQPVKQRQRRARARPAQPRMHAFTSQEQQHSSHTCLR